MDRLRKLWRKKPLEALGVGKNPLKRTLGPLHLILFGIGVVIGAGLFSITGIAAAQNAGPAITLSFIIAALGCALAGLCYSEFAALIPVSGSAYTYAYATLGELIAWIIGWDLILEYAVGAATVSISWSGYFVSLMEDFGVVVPKHLTSPINFPAAFINVMISYLLILGIRTTSFVNNLMVAVKLFVVFAFIILGWNYIRPENHLPLIPENQGMFGAFGWSGILKASGVIFFAYIGFDAVSTATQETKKPSRDMPIGILGSLAICTVLYVLFSWVLTGVVNYKELGVDAPVAVAIDKMPYPWLKSAIKLAILSGFTSVILVLLLGQSRIFYTMASDGLLPRYFASIHPRYHTPWISNLVLMAFTALFGALLPLEIVGHMTSIGTLFAFVIVCIGVLFLRKTHPEMHRPFKVPFSPFVPLLGIGVCSLMIFSLGPENWLRLILWLIIGLAIYFFYGQHHSDLITKDPKDRLLP